ncbi:hypothetical protein D9619_000219 [Psilocybe cf. subviscida]|uniref:Alpha-L-arabinofuranosidase n=1 Tax=Psilocybe cf. subviscida TaxID=2480587 RepID=A0A8H5BD78_9AGAR|nr:hypothetical protein D9619_000219 [Psilocybe cf. subviscida]
MFVRHLSNRSHTLPIPLKQISRRQPTVSYDSCNMGDRFRRMIHCAPFSNDVESDLGRRYQLMLNILQYPSISQIINHLWLAIRPGFGHATGFYDTWSPRLLMLRKVFALLALCAAVQAQSPVNGRCGGQGWTGPTTCVSGSTCVYSNPWYSQCQLASGGGGTTTTTPRLTTVRVTTTSPVTQPTGTVSLPSSFKWSSSGPLIGPKSDSRNVKGIKDPSVVYHSGKWHVFASIATAAGYNLVYISFTDWSNAGSASFYYLDQAPLGSGYRAAPQVFFFAPQNLWYLVYQNGNAAYSTNPDISNPSGWTAPKTFYSGMPTIIKTNIGNGYWVDMWVICDSLNCHLFSSDDNGHLYRSQTSLSKFPTGMGEPVIAMQDSNINRLWEASNVYHVQNSKTPYLLLIEAIGSDNRRYFRSWTSSSIAGPWIALADSESNPFARASNVVFSGATWTKDISHGEMIRASNDQTLTINPCNIRYLYQGFNPSAGGDYDALPYKLGLLTQTNSAC